MYLNLATSFCIALALNGWGRKVIHGQNDSKAVKICAVAGKNVYQSSNSSTFFYMAGMAIDADGSPRAYHKDDSKALDYLHNGGRPGDWWALVTVNGKPYIQKADDPYPGYYMSMTSLEDTDKKETDPERYVNAETIPYIVLPQKVEEAGGAKLGDFAVVLNKANGKLCYAIFADGGPPGKLGEGSIALAKALDIDANPKDGGVPDNIIYLVFPGSGNKQKRTLEEINTEGGKLFAAWGGKEMLLSFYK